MSQSTISQSEENAHAVERVRAIIRKTSSVVRSKFYVEYSEIIFADEVRYSISWTSKTALGYAHGVCLPVKLSTVDEDALQEYMEELCFKVALTGKPRRA
jgi:hypothetical protein